MNKITTTIPPPKCSEQEEILLNAELLSLIPEHEIKRVFGQKECEISGEFLGFIDTYKALSTIIPKHFTVVDIGCAYNAQSYYFTEHAKYISVDPEKDMEMFCPPNCETYCMTASDFIGEYVHTLNLETTFAICNYVPGWYKQDPKELVRKYFPNCYVFYPA